jgi:transposase-like protein
VGRVIVVVDKSTEFNEVTIVWLGGMSTKHRVARPVGKYEQLKDYRLLTERVTQLHDQGLYLAQIANRLNDEGFVPPRRRGAFTEAAVGEFVRNLGLIGELFRADMVEKDEWWIPDLARTLGVISQKIHYWVRQVWVYSRRTPSEKHLIVWADKDEIRRLRRLAKRKNSWIAIRHPELTIPKARPGR